MADKLKVTKEDIRQEFFNIASEKERECGDWQMIYYNAHYACTVIPNIIARIATARTFQASALLL